jgi:TetR/AcrR family tetracycline transcriptional repressor
MARQATPASGTSGERLSRERILETATGLVVQHGLEALSMRRLAHELDVWPMSLYRYFRDKDELVAALADSAAQRIPSPDAAAPWREQMHALLDPARAAIERYPSSLSPQANGTAAGHVRTAGLAILQRAGLDEANASRAWQALLAYTAGAAAFSLTTADFDYGLGRLLDGLESTLRDTAAARP